MSVNSGDAEDASTQSPTSLSEPNGAEISSSRKVTLSISTTTSTSPAPPSTTDGDTLPLRGKHPKFYKRKKAVEAVIFIGGIVILWTLLALVVVAYHIPPGSNDEMPTNATNTSSEATCSAEVYTGVVCLASLQVWQSCIPDRANSTDVFIVNRTGVTQEAIESEFTSFLTMFSIVSPSAECQAAALPFYCLMNFGLCGNDSQPYLPTSQQCMELTVACESEFQLIGASQPELIPDCAALPDTGIDCSSMDSLTCSAEVYTGAVCLAPLQVWQSCIPDRAGSTDIFIVDRPGVPQEAIESEFTSFLTMFSIVSPSAECQVAALPFYCLMNFGLCGNDSRSYLPTSQQCLELTAACESEFQLIGASQPELIPDCTALPDTGIDCSSQNSSSNSSSDTNIATPTLNCSDGFFLDDIGGVTLCVPECGEWEELSHGAVVAFDVIVGLQAALYIIVATIALVCAVIRHERMFKFPSILLVYALIPFGVFEIILLISFTDRKELFCTQRNLINVLRVDDPTHFCVFSGVAFYYLSLQQGFLWLCHVISVFWGVMFPFHFRRWEKKRYFRFVHLGMLAVVVVLPIIPVIAAVSTGGFSVPRFPPNTCLASSFNATFYGFVLLAIIILGAGVCLVILVLWRLSYLLRGRRLERRKTEVELRTQRRVQSKVLLIVIYFFLFLLESQVAFTFALREAPEFRQAIGDYFMCEAFGVTRMCNRSMYFDRTAGQAAVTIGYVILGFYPVVNLMFFVDIKEIKRKVRKWLKMPVEDSVANNSISLGRRRTADRDQSSPHRQ